MRKTHTNLHVICGVIYLGSRMYLLTLPCISRHLINNYIRLNYFGLIVVSVTISPLNQIRYFLEHDDFQTVLVAVDSITR